MQSSSKMSTYIMSIGIIQKSREFHLKYKKMTCFAAVVSRYFKNEFHGIQLFLPLYKYIGGPTEPN